MIEIERTLARIREPDRGAMRVAQERSDDLTKPPGSLGRLEEVAVRVSGIVGRAGPRLDRRAVVVMAADHGVAARGVSAYPREVTAQMLANFVAGGAAINVLARRASARVVVVDMGVDAPPIPGVIARRIARGTADMTTAPAMSRDDAARAIAAGIGVLEDEVAAGLDVVATGDMGIGNTTAASAITAVMAAALPSSVVGRGTGIDDATLARKVAAVERGIALHRPDAADPLGVLSAVGGFEIGGLVGVILGACAHRIPVVLDGFISGAAALIAARMHGAVAGHLIAAHRSAEPGHTVALAALGLRPLLELELRLGEGTGAVLALPLIDAATAVLREMATFGSAGVSRA